MATELTLSLNSLFSIFWRFKGIFSFRDYLCGLKIVGNTLPSGLSNQMYFNLKYVCICAYCKHFSVTDYSCPSEWINNGRCCCHVECTYE